MREYDREITDLKRQDFDERSSRYSDGSRSPSPESKQARFQNIDKPLHMYLFLQKYYQLKKVAFFLKLKFLSKIEIFV